MNTIGGLEVVTMQIWSHYVRSASQYVIFFIIANLGESLRSSELVRRYRSRQPWFS